MLVIRKKAYVLRITPLTGSELSVIIFPVVLSTEYIVAVLSPALEQIKLLPELVRHMSEAALLDLWSRLTVNIF